MTISQTIELVNDIDFFLFVETKENSSFFETGKTLEIDVVSCRVFTGCGVWKNDFTQIKFSLIKMSSKVTEKS